MGTPRLLDCQPDERLALESALNRIRTVVKGDTLSTLGLDVLRRKLQERLNGKRRFSVRCRDCRNRSGLVSLKDREKGEIELCRAAFSLGLGRITAALFRELVRICGGSTLDVEALQHHCFPGAGPLPSADAFELFRKRPVVRGLHAGYLVLWNPETGELFVRQGSGSRAESGQRLSPTFWPPGVEPSPATDQPPEPGLIWEESDPVGRPAEVEPEPDSPNARPEPVAAQTMPQNAPSGVFIDLGIPVKPGPARSVDSPATPSEASESEPDLTETPDPKETPDPTDSPDLATKPVLTTTLPPLNTPDLPPMPPIPPMPAMQTNWFDTPMPTAALMMGLQVPPEAKELVQELMALGSRTPVEWGQVLQQMTEFLLETTVAPKNSQGAKSGVADETPSP